MEVLSSPWVHVFERFLCRVQDSLLISSPFVGRAPCDVLVSVLAERLEPSRLNLLVLTNLSRDNMLAGSTDPFALLQILEAFPLATIRFLPSLHAKVYVADHSAAIVTSANLTQSGLTRNLELGVWLEERTMVCQVRDQVESYASLGTLITRQQLEQFAQIVDDLRELKRRVEASADNRLRAEFDRRLERADVQVLRTRTAGRAAHAIFADAILYLLRNGPRQTPDLHREIQGIHPDLCDDNVDRIIDGRRFGKKWKHAVRTAQQYLKKKGLVRFESGAWMLA